MAIDKLKDVWKNQPISKIQFTETDIYKMIHKKSTSLVKWIFYISIIEFVVLILPTLFMDSPSLEKEFGITQFENELGIVGFVKIVNIINYVIIVPFFIYSFYKNYKNICVNNTSKKLMSNILKTKKTVSYYVYSQLFIAAFTLIYILYKLTLTASFQSHVEVSMVLVWLIFSVIIAITLLVVWLVYKLLYGILLNKLNKNYKELLKEEE